MHRFGQTQPVECHVVRSENEGSIVDIVREKERTHSEFQKEISNLMEDSMKENLGLKRVSVAKYVAETPIQLPSFLTSRGV